jgi:hypothetical protein
MARASDLVRPPAGRGQLCGRGWGVMRVGEVLVYQGRLHILRGADPSSVFPRCAELEDAETRERHWVAIEELGPDKDEGQAPVGQ